MKMHLNRWIVSALCCWTLVTSAKAAQPTTVLYATSFEADENYSLELDLGDTTPSGQTGQNGWLGFGSKQPYWNGILTNYFSGLGQQGYIGFTAPTDTDGTLTVWQPNITAVPSGQPIVKFSTLMAIGDSTNERFDDFRWSAYNTSGQRLFTLDFDNYALEVNYALDDVNGFVSTGKKFEVNKIYELVIIMDLARNKWSARIDDIPLVTEKAITTTFASLALGDVDAVWSIRDTAHPGNNFMAFDNYQLTAYATAVPPEVHIAERLPDGSNLMRLYGEPNKSYTIEATADFQTWMPISTSTPPEGILEYLDTAAAGQPKRFYRAKAN
jgi:hypothetical protein